MSLGRGLIEPVYSLKVNFPWFPLTVSVQPHNCIEGPALQQGPPGGGTWTSWWDNSTLAVSVLCSEERPHFVTQACLTNARIVCALLCPATHCIVSSLHSQESEILVNYFTAYFSTDWLTMDTVQLNWGSVVEYIRIIRMHQLFSQGKNLPMLPSQGMTQSFSL